MLAGLESGGAPVGGERNDMMEKEKKALYPPCEIGDTVYMVGDYYNGILPPYIDEYSVEQLLWDGEKWSVLHPNGAIFEIGTDDAILDEGAALARFRELRDEYMKNKNLL